MNQLSRYKYTKEELLANPELAITIINELEQILKDISHAAAIVEHEEKIWEVREKELLVEMGYASLEEFEADLDKDFDEDHFNNILKLYTKEE